MNDEYVKNYIALGARSSICVFRERLEKLPLLVASVYIMGKPGSYIVSVEFDPIDMIDDGEGWVWHSDPMDLAPLISKLEGHLNRKIDNWENVNKTGGQVFRIDDIDSRFCTRQEQIFKEELELGEGLLPNGFVWTLKGG